jgi:hypothetical protein
MSAPKFSKSARTEVSQEQTSQFLRLALPGKRPVDRLVDRMARHDGTHWFLSLVRSGPVASFGDAEEKLVQGKASLEELKAIKKAGKLIYKTARRSDERLVGVASYFLSISAALRHHGALICSRSRQELDPILFDLASEAPPPWDRLISEAAVKADLPTQ